MWKIIYVIYTKTKPWFLTGVLVYFPQPDNTNLRKTLTLFFLE